ncbi:hypothetical protein M2267_002049 [Ensifer sp. KUDG1]|uniref:hypothetical protein n=2 Tax=unclassified Ensifer TaxID=2633371 RepID=UPI0005BD2305|nr:hypothetical protein [Ensifer sp. PDNC004]MBD9647036.1 hypothetical protein [Ensifer sp. ENS09]QRY69086.1 hypothetical protein JVX98_12695 [Ensifer sp. PDNC004]
MLAALLLASIVASPNMPDVKLSAATVDELQTDFERAVPCHQIDGRNVWKGALAFYIQSFVYDGDTPVATDAADAVLPEDNSAETVKEFEDACSTSQAT